jgi:glycerol-3-phosphate dehydrogenase (NAD(P)+)
MPIVEQVELVIEGRMSPKDIAPHLTHETEEPQGE